MKKYSIVVSITLTKEMIISAENENSARHAAMERAGREDVVMTSTRQTHNWLETAIELCEEI